MGRRSQPDAVICHIRLKGIELDNLRQVKEILMKELGVAYLEHNQVVAILLSKFIAQQEKR